MKKIIILILAVLLSLSLTACSGGIGNVETTTVTITSSNWTEYFKVSDITVAEKNAFDEPCNVYCQRGIVVKDKYKNKIHKIDVAFEVSILENGWFFVDYTVSSNKAIITPFSENDIANNNYTPQAGGYSHQGLIAKNSDGIYIGAFGFNSGNDTSISISDDKNIISAHVVLPSIYTVTRVEGTIEIKE